MSKEKPKIPALSVNMSAFADWLPGAMAETAHEAGYRARSESLTRRFENSHSTASLLGSLWEQDPGTGFGRSGRSIALAQFTVAIVDTAAIANWLSFSGDESAEVYLEFAQREAVLFTDQLTQRQHTWDESQATAQLERPFENTLFAEEFQIIAGHFKGAGQLMASQDMSDLHDRAFYLERASDKALELGIVAAQCFDLYATTLDQPVVLPYPTPRLAA